MCSGFKSIWVAQIKNVWGVKVKVEYLNIYFINILFQECGHRLINILHENS